MQRFSICSVLGAFLIAATCVQHTLAVVMDLEDDATKFYLYTNDNPDVPQELFTNNSQSLTNSNFNPDRETKFIIHGWVNSYMTTPNPELRTAYLNRKDYNIICFDWSVVANEDYLTAKANLKEVGKQCAHFINFLILTYESVKDNIGIIGHSLGAHVAGICGKHVKDQLQWIVGLDAAGPLYLPGIYYGLEASDAQRVFTLHTNTAFKGIALPIGTQSMYANCGTTQPGCGLDPMGTCSHYRSVELYASALSGTKFGQMRRCTSVAPLAGCNQIADTKLGDPTEINHLDGIFQFDTGSESPFASSSSGGTGLLPLLKCLVD